ncbi:MAG TPA: alpha/beta hydrolase [Longimicrobium sp.]|nr:alpha/beta hydrolase [Longimicrobium sp.]
MSELRAADGTPLYVQSWLAAAPRAHLLVSHGLGEHGGRYGSYTDALVPLGISVHALDHRGHGLSGGRRGHVRRFRDFVDDFEAFRLRVTAEHAGGRPVFLLGHSMGGLIAIRHLQSYPGAPWAGAILSSPLVGVGVQAPWWKVAAAGVLSRIAPALRLGNEIDAADLSSAPGYAEAYRADPLVHPYITPRLYTEMVSAIGAAFAERERIRPPLLVLSPQADRIVLPAAVGQWAEGMHGDVELVRYDGFRHESHNEVERARAVGDVARWLERRIG